MKRNVITISFMIIGFLLLIGSALYTEFYYANTSSIEIPCYDNNNNIIKGVTCEGVEEKPLLPQISLVYGFMCMGIGIIKKFLYA